MHSVIFFMDDCTSASPLFLCFMAIGPAIPNNITLSMFLFFVHKILSKLLLAMWVDHALCLELKRIM